MRFNDELYADCTYTKPSKTALTTIDEWTLLKKGFLETIETTCERDRDRLKEITKKKLKCAYWTEQYSVYWPAHILSDSMQICNPSACCYSFGRMVIRYADTQDIQEA